MSRDPGLSTRTTAASAIADVVFVAAPWDSLSNPSNDDLVGAGLSMWPTGPAWGSPDGQAISIDCALAKFTRSLLNTFEWLYARAFKLARESSVSGVDELLPDWERDFGLPDSCAGSGGTIAERIRALEAKVNSQAVITPSDFVRVAMAYGFEITIEEPAIFECGFSECGGEHTVGDPRQEIYWVVRVIDLAIDYFRAGESEVGFDPLFSLGGAETLLCILRKLAPAWSEPVLSDVD